MPDSHAGKGTGEAAAKTVKGAEAVKEGNPDRASQPVKAGKGAGGDVPSGEKRALVRLCSSILNPDVFDFESCSIGF